MTPDPTGLGYYDRAHIWSDEGEYASLAEAHRAETVAGLVADLRPRRVLDVGAGNGIVTNRLMEAGLEVVAFDFSEVALRGVRGLKVTGDVAAMPFEDCSFDLSILSEVLEHLGPGTFGRARREVARVSRRHVVITVPNREDLLATAVVCPSCGCRSSAHRHVRRFDDGDFAELIPDFAPVSVFTFGPVDQRVRRIEAAIRRDVLGRWPWPAPALCPQCGYTSGQAFQPASRARLLATLARPARVRRARWLAAVLERST